MGSPSKGCAKWANGVHPRSIRLNCSGREVGRDFFNLKFNFNMNNKVTLCRQGNCLHIQGEWAEAIAAAVLFATIAYGTAQVVKLLR